MSGTITNNKQNLGKYVFLQIVLLHFTGIAIQKGIIATVAHRQCVLINMLEGPGMKISYHEGFHLYPVTSSKRDDYPVLNSLATWHWV